MPLRTLLRTSGVWILAPVAAGLAWWAATENLSAAPGYRVADTANALLGAALLAPLFAAACAWQTSRLRRGRVLSKGGVRNPVLVVFTTIWPLLLGALFAVVFCVVTTVPDSPTWPLVAMSAAVLLSHALAGAWLGLLTRIYVAVPVAAMLSYLWLGLPAGIVPEILAHLNGNVIGCCARNEAFDPRSAAAVLMVAGGVMVGTLVALTQHNAWLSTTTWTAVVAAAGLGGALLVSPVQDRDPVRTRTDAPACRPGVVEICVWPEHTSDLPRLHQIVGDLQSRWQTVGVTMPARLSEPSTDSGLEIPYDADWTDNDIRASLTAHVLPGASHCGRLSDTGVIVRQTAWASGQAAEETFLWLLLVGGIPDEYVRQQATVVGTLTAARRIRSLPVADQERWFRGRLEFVRTCGGKVD